MKSKVVVVSKVRKTKEKLAASREAGKQKVVVEGSTQAVLPTVLQTVHNTCFSRERRGLLPSVREQAMFCHDSSHPWKIGAGSIKLLFCFKPEMAPEKKAKQEFLEFDSATTMRRSSSDICMLHSRALFYLVLPHRAR